MTKMFEEMMGKLVEEMVDFNWDISISVSGLSRIGTFSL